MTEAEALALETELRKRGMIKDDLTTPMGQQAAKTYASRTINEALSKSDKERQDAYKALYTPEYAAEYMRQRQQRLAEELGAADLLRQGMETGETSAALAGQRLAMGQTAAQRAVAAASQGPLAARQAIGMAAPKTLESLKESAMGRMQEMQGAREAQTAAYLRQLGYAQALASEDMRRKQMLQQALLGRQQQGFQFQQQQQAMDRQMAQGILGGASSALQAGIEAWKGQQAKTPAPGGTTPPAAPTGG